MPKQTVKKLIESLGFAHSNTAEYIIRELSINKPNYRLLADIILHNLQEYSSEDYFYDCKYYAYHFVDLTKGNLIQNNKNFQLAVREGCINPKTQKPNPNFKIFHEQIYSNNRFEYVDEVEFATDNEIYKADFTLFINDLPLISIFLVEGDTDDYFGEKIDYLYDFIDEVPNFFNFNKLIILSNGDRYYLSTIDNLFLEECIKFTSNSNNYSDFFSLEYLREILKSKNIIPYLINNSKNSDFNQLIVKMQRNTKIQAPKKINLIHKEQDCVDIFTIQKKPKENDITNYIDEEDLQEINFDTNTHEDLDISDKMGDLGVFIEPEEDEETDEIDFFGGRRFSQKENEEDRFIKDEIDSLENFYETSLDDILESKEFKDRLDASIESVSFKENKEYILAYQEDENSQQAITKLIKANKRLVGKYASSYMGYETTSFALEDMMQFGYMGLIKAAERFDLGRDVEFSTYATFWIKQSIMRGITDDSLTIRVPAHRWQDIFKFNKMERKSVLENGIVDYKWIAEQLDYTPEELEEIKGYRNNYFRRLPSLDLPVGDDKDTTLGSFIEDKQVNLEDEVNLNLLKTTLEEVMNELTEREKKVITMRFGLDNGADRTLEEVGAVMGVTRERIRQIETKALKKLRDSSKSIKLKDFFDEKPR